MGNYMTKFFPHNNESNKSNENEEEKIRNSINDKVMESECMLTPPVISKILPVDPRSATSGITRTPIEVDTNTPMLNKRLSAIPKYLQRKPYLETDIDYAMCLTPKKQKPRPLIETEKLQIPNLEDECTEELSRSVDSIDENKLMSEIQKERYDILGLDPRSPAADFDRTPPLGPRSLALLRARSRETLQRQGSYEASQLYPSYSYCEMSSQFDVTEVQALPDLASCVLKSLNLDTMDDKSSEVDSECSSQANGTNSPLEDEKKSEDQEIQTVEEDTCNDKDTQKKRLEGETCANDNIIIKVWRDSLVSDKSQKLETDDIKIVQNKMPQAANEETITIFDEDNSASDKLPVKVAKSDKLKLDTVGKKKRRTEIKDEKKIFADKSSNGTTVMARIPLGNRSNAYEQTQVAKSSPQQMFRNKGVTPKMLQENTPTHKRSVAKSKAMQWDPNSTFII